MELLPTQAVLARSGAAAPTSASTSKWINEFRRRRMLRRPSLRNNSPAAAVPFPGNPTTPDNAEPAAAAKPQRRHRYKFRSRAQLSGLLTAKLGSNSTSAVNDLMANFDNALSLSQTNLGQAAAVGTLQGARLHAGLSEELTLSEDEHEAETAAAERVDAADERDLLVWRLRSALVPAFAQDTLWEETIDKILPHIGRFVAPDEKVTDARPPSAEQAPKVAVPQSVSAVVNLQDWIRAS